MKGIIQKKVTATTETWWVAETILAKTIPKSPYGVMLRTSILKISSLSLFLSAKMWRTTTSTEIALILWFQSSGALSTYYLFAEQVKCMHKLPPNYDDTRWNKLKPSKNNFLIPRQDHKTVIFFTDTVDQIHNLSSVIIQPTSSHNCMD